ncbi:MAG: hypothetical protein ACR2NR_16610 [Solirubrobacteraceae bacterium]
MSATAPHHRARHGSLVAGALAAGLLGCGVAVMLIVAVLAPPQSAACGDGGPGSNASVTLGPPGSGRRVGATEYGGPGDPHTGSVGSSGVNLLAHPDSYAELGGTTFASATAMGGLAYMTPLRITWGDRSAIAYKRDIGLGGGPVAGLPRVIDLWWQFAGALRIPYDDGLWSGAVRVQRPPAAGAGGVLGQSAVPVSAAPPASGSPGASGTSGTSGCAPSSGGTVELTPGPRARVLASGTVAAPAGAPPAVKAIISAGHQIVGKPYQYGGGHGLALDQVSPTYDCSSSVEHLLYGARLLPVNYDAASGELESFGRSGLGRWVTIYASADHVFMYVAGLRWDTHNAAGPDDGSTGIGWHPLVRSAAGFAARHPVGL